MKNQYVRVFALFLAILASQLVSAQCSIPITYLQQTTCQGAPYNFNGHMVDTAGTYNDTIQVAGGCDSIVQLQLFVIPILYTNVYDTICPGGTYSFNGQTLTTAGTFGDTLFYGTNFCDSVILLHLALRQSHNDTFTITTTYCATAGGPGGGGGGGYNFFGTRETASGTYVYIGGTLPGAGTTCADSVVILYLTVGAAPITIGAPAGGFRGGPDTVKTCNSSYNFYGTTLTTTGYYSDTIHSSIGCDSIRAYIYLELNSNYNTALVNGTSCGGAPFIWRGTSYPGPAGGGGGGGRAATYYDTIAVAGGCDTIYTISVRNGFPPPPVSRIDSFCAGSSYTYAGSTFTVAGTDTVYVPSATGCDTTLILTLVYKAAPTYLWVDSFCEGSNYTYRGNTYTDSGLHFFTVPAPAGCDSIIKVYLSYKSAPTINILDSFCHGTTYTYRGHSYTTAGVHAITIAAPSGCDSVINLNLSYTTPPSATIVDSFCQGTVYVYGIDTFTSRGNYNIIVSHPGVCDSAIALTLTTIRAPRMFVRDSFCQGTAYYYGADSFTTAGTYTVVLPASVGCDTTVTLRLVYKTAPTPPVISPAGSVLVVNPAATSYQWYLNGTAIVGANAQAYTVTQSGVYTVITQSNGSCEGISAGYTVTNVGITEVSSDMFTLYPNPNNGLFTLETAQFLGTDITIYDVLGRPVYQKQLITSKESIDMSGTTDGTYYLVMKNQQFTRYAHFVVAR